MDDSDKYPIISGHRRKSYFRSPLEIFMRAMESEDDENIVYSVNGWLYPHGMTVISVHYCDSCKINHVYRVIIDSEESAILAHDLIDVSLQCDWDLTAI